MSQITYLVSFFSNCQHAEGMWTVYLAEDWSLGSRFCELLKEKETREFKGVGNGVSYWAI